MKLHRPSYNESTRHQDQFWKNYQQFFPVSYRSPEPNPPPREEWWSWKNYRIHIDRVDIAHAPAKVILLHGAGGYGRFLSPLGFAVARHGYSWLAPDLPGYGLTSPRSNSLRYEDWIDAVSAIVDHESMKDQRPIVLFGLSLGGMLAYHVACTNKRVAGVIGTCFLDFNRAEVRAAVVKQAWFATSGIKLLEKCHRLLDPIWIPIGRLTKLDKMSNDPRFNSLVARDRLGGANWLPLRFVHSLVGVKPALEPERFTAPLLLAQPADDRWTPFELTEPFYNRLGGPKRLVMLENCGHAPIEKPGIDQLEAAVASFIEDLVHGRFRAYEKHRRRQKINDGESFMPSRPAEP